MSEVDKFLSEVPKEGIDQSEEQEQKDTAPESAPENKPDETTPPVKEDKQDDDKKVPFHEDPKIQEYISRQVEKDVQTRIDGELQKRFAPKSEVSIPEWFGGSEEQYKKFLSDQDTLVQKRFDDFQQKQRQAQFDQERRVQENTQYIDGELKKLKDEGKEFDKNELFAVVRDFRPLAEDGVHWDFKRAQQILEQRNKDKPNKAGRKQLAASTTDTSKDTSIDDFQTPETLKNKGWKFF